MKWYLEIFPAVYFPNESKQSITKEEFHYKIPVIYLVLNHLLVK